MRGKVRIISGIWKSRLIRFDESANIRPTTDAARETLFNWLQSETEGACCLDLFAGSGALGFEALSRGAKSVVFVDSDHRSIQCLLKTAEELDAKNVTVIHKTAEDYLSSTDATFDLVFIDPPFYKNVIPGILEQLRTSGCIHLQTQIYVEMEHGESGFGGDWTIVKEKRSKVKNYFLIAQNFS